MKARALILPVAALAVATGGVAHVTASPAHGAATRTVTLRHIAFSPSRVTVARGDRVRFAWRDGNVSHNVTSQGRVRFRSIGTRANGSAEVRFARPGTYRYVCTIHFGMKGTITVR